jgi:hypothetical protein
MPTLTQIRLHIRCIMKGSDLLFHLSGIVDAIFPSVYRMRKGRINN